MAKIKKIVKGKIESVDSEVTSFSHLSNIHDDSEEFEIRMGDHAVAFTTEEMRDIIEEYNTMSQEQDGFDDEGEGNDDY